MRRLILATMLLTSACEADAPELAHVQQATTDDGKADSVLGQPDLNTGTLPTIVDAFTAESPVGLGTPNVAADGAILWIPDRARNRAVGFNVGATPYANWLAGQSVWDGRAAGGGATGMSGPSAAAQAFNQVAFADTGNHRVLFGYAGGFPFYPGAVFGQHGSFDGDTPNAGGLSNETLSSPSGVTFDASFSPGRMLVSDTGNHRVLVFGLATPVTTTAALACYGQPDCKSGAPNRGGAPTSASFSSPRGIANWFDAKNLTDPWRGFFVADSGNHRVLHYRVFDTKADFVWGQGGDFTTGVPSKGGPSATSLRDPTAVAVANDGSLWVADTGHHRVLHFPKGSATADRVLGQPDFTTVGAPTTVSASTLRAPEGVAVAANGDVWVADTGNHRVLRYRVPCTPTSCNDGNPCTNDRCDVTNGCVHELSVLSTECAPYRCDVATSKCSKPCTAAAPCAPPYLCQAGRCVLRCFDASDCAGRPCAGGFCCDRPCTGPCESCALTGSEGTCSVASAGSPPTGHSCGTTDECGARCDGIHGDRCVVAPTGTTCGYEACANGVAQQSGTCDGRGTCVSRSRVCAPYACAANGCLDACAGDHQCVKGARCVGGACVPESTFTGSGGCAVGRTAPPWALLPLLLLFPRRRRR